MPAASLAGEEARREGEGNVSPLEVHDVQNMEIPSSLPPSSAAAPSPAAASSHADTREAEDEEGTPPTSVALCADHHEEILNSDALHLLYSLTAFITHSGRRIDSGHYVAFIRSSSSFSSSSSSSSSVTGSSGSGNSGALVKITRLEHLVRLIPLV